MYRTCCGFLPTIALFAFSCVPASASTIGPLTTSTPVPATLTDWASSLLFPKFDGTLGTLLSVEITTSVGLDTKLTITNNALSASSGHGKAEVIVTLSDPLTDFSQVTDSIWPAGLGFAYSLDAGATVTSPLLLKTDSSDVLYNAASPNGGAILSEFTGSGNIALPVSTFTQTLLANTGGNTSSSQVTHASATGTITYSYSASAGGVPGAEPATLAMLGSALLGLGLFGRKRFLR